ncbi:hypothetical protein CL656_04465 [bacterium]|nr:hypothetical protein [bacterium]
MRNFCKKIFLICVRISAICISPICSIFKSIKLDRDILIASSCNIIVHNHQYNLKEKASTEYYDSFPFK